MKHRPIILLSFMALALLFSSAFAQDSSNVRLVGYLDLEDGARDIELSGNYAYLTGDGLYVVDINDPTNPNQVAYFETPEGVIWTAWAVSISGSYAYVASGDAGLWVFNISDPTDPDSVTMYDTPMYSVELDVSGNHVYLVAYEGLQVIDVTNPSEPEGAGIYESPEDISLLNVTISGNYAYIVTMFGLLVLNISDPTSPDSVGFCETHEDGIGQSVTISGNYAYFADDLMGLRVISV